MAEQEYVPTVEKIETLLRETSLSASQLVDLCNARQVKISGAKLSMARTQGKFLSHVFDQAMRVILFDIEDLIERAKPFQVSFENTENVLFLMSLLKEGHDVSVQILLKPDEKNSEKKYGEKQ